MINWIILILIVTLFLCIIVLGILQSRELHNMSKPFLCGTGNWHNVQGTWHHIIEFKGKIYFDGVEIKNER